MARILLLSNGHGEDLSGALLAIALKKFGHEVAALPFVGRGHSYRENNIEIIGKTKDFSTGGLGYTSLRGRITEVFQGQILYLIKRLMQLLLVANRYDIIIVIGDVIPVIAAWLTRIKVITYLVAYSSHYEGRLNLPWPCGSLLSSRRFLKIYARDRLTATDLTTQLQRKVTFLGNPFMDAVLAPRPSLRNCENRLGLLPGSRRPELDNNIFLMLKTIELLEERNYDLNDLSLDMALVSIMDSKSLKQLCESAGWIYKDSLNNLNITQLIRGKCIINVHRNSFAQVLQSSDVLFSMAGTASEQAIGLSKPVVQLPGFGPQFTTSFAEAQRRLLGPTVFCADGKPGDQSTLISTAVLILDVLKGIKSDQSFVDECKEQAEQRLGLAGGGQDIAQEITRIVAGLY